MGHDDAAVEQWARTAIEEGLAAYAALLPEHGRTFSVGNIPSLADFGFIPQLVNARRFGVEVSPKRIL